MTRTMLLAAVCAWALGTLATAEPIKVLIVDGQNNHDWRATTPLMKKALEETGLFQVDVATAPPQDTAGFKPEFAKYQVVLSNYNGADWPADTQQALVDFVQGGGGLVVVHAANNSFPNWKEYNEMIGLGGWGGRNEKWGPYIRFRDGQFVRDTQPGGGGSHGAAARFSDRRPRSESPGHRRLAPLVDARQRRAVRPAARPGRKHEGAGHGLCRKEPGGRWRAQPDDHGARLRQGGTCFTPRWATARMPCSASASLRFCSAAPSGQPRAK